MEHWNDVSNGNYPQDGKIVQVTYLGYYNKEPYCDAFAFRKDGKWLWNDNESEPIVEITAWKECCEPYRGN